MCVCLLAVFQFGSTILGIAFNKLLCDFDFFQSRMTWEFREMWFSVCAGAVSVPPLIYKCQINFLFLVLPKYDKRVECESCSLRWHAKGFVMLVNSNFYPVATNKS